MASFAHVRSWQGMVGRYLGIPVTGESLKGIRAWGRAIRVEGERRYGPAVARLTIRATGYALLGQMILNVAGIVGICSFAGGSFAVFLAGVLCAVAGPLVMLMGLAEGKSAGELARAAGIERGAMTGFLMSRDRYLRWYEQQGQKPYPFARES